MLDDYQAITSPRIHHTMTFFLTYLPGSHHVIMITRSDPPFPLAGRGTCALGRRRWMGRCGRTRSTLRGPDFRLSSFRPVFSDLPYLSCLAGNNQPQRLPSGAFSLCTCTYNRRFSRSAICVAVNSTAPLIVPLVA